LPFIDYRLQLCEGPCTGRELSLGTVVEIHAGFKSKLS
jgi:hypothetical protein